MTAKHDNPDSKLPIPSLETQREMVAKIEALIAEGVEQGEAVQTVFEAYRNKKD